MKHFTPDEASSALASVRPLAETLVAEHRALEATRVELASLRVKVAGNGGGLDTQRVLELQATADRAAEAVGHAIEEIHRLGAQVKDLGEGLIDFPAVHPVDGATVLLCWRVGEEDVGYWHGLEEGFAGRKPLPF